MLFRPNMVCELEAANCLDGAIVICLVWAGYLEAPANERFVAWLRDRAIQYHHCHTSGPASVADLRLLRDAFPTAFAVLVHLADRVGFAKLFSNLKLPQDGQWWEIT